MKKEKFFFWVGKLIQARISNAERNQLKGLKRQRILLVRLRCWSEENYPKDFIPKRSTNLILLRLKNVTSSSRKCYTGRFFVNDSVFYCTNKKDFFYGKVWFGKPDSQSEFKLSVCERCTGGSTNYKTAGLLDGPQRNLTIL